MIVDMTTDIKVLIQTGVQRLSLLVLLAILLMPTSCAIPAKMGISVTDSWASKPAGTQATVIAGFMCIENPTPIPVEIVSASSEEVNRIEVHEIVHEQGIVHMKKIDSLNIPAESSVCLEPEGIHLMLMGISDSVHQGDDIQIEIQTAAGDTFEVLLPQRALTSTH